MDISIGIDFSTDIDTVILAYKQLSLHRYKENLIILGEDSNYMSTLLIIEKETYFINLIN